MRERFPNLIEHPILKVEVGVHNNVQVTSGMKSGGDVDLCLEPEQRITQVFTAAMNMGGAPRRGDGWVDTYCADVAQWILRASYQGTILAAIENARSPETEGLPGRNKLFLTMMGGGVFGNRISWIIDAMKFNKPLLETSGLQVYVILFSMRGLSEMDIKNFKSLVDESGGNIENVD